jgi:hypothetical protein
MRFKQDLSILENSLKTLVDDVKDREAILNKRQDMESHLADYCNMLKMIKDKAVQMGELKKKSTRNTANMNELMLERQKLSAINEKQAKEKASAVDRHSKLLQKSNSISQTLQRRLQEITNTHNSLET